MKSRPRRFSATVSAPFRGRTVDRTDRTGTRRRSRQPRPNLWHPLDDVESSSPSWGPRQPMCHALRSQPRSPLKRAGATQSRNGLMLGRKFASDESSTGQVHHHAGAGAIFTARASDRTPVRFDNLAAEIEADASTKCAGLVAGAVELLLDPKELLENALAEGFGDALAGIRHGNMQEWRAAFASLLR